MYAKAEVVRLFSSGPTLLFVGSSFGPSSLSISLKKDLMVIPLFKRIVFCHIIIQLFEPYCFTNWWEREMCICMSGWPSSVINAKK